MPRQRLGLTRLPQARDLALQLRDLALQLRDLTVQPRLRGDRFGSRRGVTYIKVCRVQCYCLVRSGSR